MIEHFLNYYFCRKISGDVWIRYNLWLNIFKIITFGLFEILQNNNFLKYNLQHKL